MPQSGDPLIQVKQETPNSLLGETSGASNSGMLNTYSLNGILQSGQWCWRSLFGLSVLLEQLSFHFFFFFNSLFLCTESKCDKGNLYNFSKLKKSRRWLKVRQNVYSSNSLLNLQNREVTDSSWHIGVYF